MDEAAITLYITDTFAGVDVSLVDGDSFFFNNAGLEEPDFMFPFATIVTGDRYEAEPSNLDRPGVFRLNVGVSRDTFRSLFGEGGADARNDDFTALDTIMPHPEYGSMFWLCVLNPSAATFETIRPMLAEAYGLAAERLQRRRPKAE